jgi:hypothetical protein
MSLQALISVPAGGQQATGTPGSPSTTTIGGQQLPPPVIAAAA